MALPDPKSVERVTCVGSGTIGGGWAAYFLSQGMDVVASDPGPDAERNLRDLVSRAWPKLEQLGLADGASPERLRFEPDLASALADTQFVQESAPDREELKIELFEKIDAATAPDVVISSSSSQFIPTSIASRCAHPERVIIGHPFAPSYLLPLVEVVGGEKTDEAVLDWAMTFYTAVGKHALKLRNEIEFYISNRLQSVVSQEIHSLVQAGICNYEEADRAVVYGPGLRWAFAGPLLCSHMGGGRGGIRGSIAHWGWNGPPELEAQAISEAEESAGTDMAAIESWRDDNLLIMLKQLTSFSRK